MLNQSLHKNLLRVIKMKIKSTIKIPADYMVDHSTTLHSDGLESSSSSLQFTIQPNHFGGQKGQLLRIKCLSSLAKMHTLSSEVLVFKAAQFTPSERPKSLNEETNEILPSNADLNWQSGMLSFFNFR